VEPRHLEPLQQEVRRQRRVRDRGWNATAAMKNASAGSIVSGPQITPATIASRRQVRCRTTGSTTIAPMML
jgi:hypothetical protein